MLFFLCIISIRYNTTRDHPVLFIAQFVHLGTDLFDIFTEVIKIQGFIFFVKAKKNESQQDSSNGYRYRKVYKRGRLLELILPRMRNGNIYPIRLGLLSDQEKAKQLYGAG